MSRQLQGLLNEVDGPAEADFAQVPTTVPASHFLDRHWLTDFSRRIQGLGDHAIDGVEQRDL